MLEVKDRKTKNIVFFFWKCQLFRAGPLKTFHQLVFRLLQMVVKTAVSSGTNSGKSKWMSGKIRPRNLRWANFGTFLISTSPAVYFRRQRRHLAADILTSSRRQRLLPRHPFFSAPDDSLPTSSFFFPPSPPPPCSLRSVQGQGGAGGAEWGQLVGNTSHSHCSTLLYSTLLQSF